MKAGLFEQAAERTAKVAASKYGFGAAASTIVVWAVVGPYFQFSEVWQLVINTGTTIITYLMMFLLLNASTREAKALSVKLDEVIRAIEGANNKLIGLETKTETEIEQASKEVQRAAVEPGDFSRWWKAKR